MSTHANTAFFCRTCGYRERPCEVHPDLCKPLDPPKATGLRWIARPARAQHFEMLPFVVVAVDSKGEEQCYVAEALTFEDATAIAGSRENAKRVKELETVLVRYATVLVPSPPNGGES